MFTCISLLETQKPLAVTAISSSRRTFFQNLVAVSPAHFHTLSTCLDIQLFFFISYNNKTLRLWQIAQAKIWHVMPLHQQKAIVGFGLL